MRDVSFEGLTKPISAEWGAVDTEGWIGWVSWVLR